jgi:hypothetical protein
MMPRLAELDLPPGAPRRWSGASMAEVLCQAEAMAGHVLCCRARLAVTTVGALIQGAWDEDAAVRALCLAALAMVARWWRRRCARPCTRGRSRCSSPSRRERCISSRRRAPLRLWLRRRRPPPKMVGLLLQRLGADAVAGQSGNQLVCLSAARDGAAGEVLRAHVQQPRFSMWICWVRVCCGVPARSPVSRC